MTAAAATVTAAPAHPAQVSVIMPVFNAERTMRKSIESVLRQTHRDLELVAIDDGSSDASLAILVEYADADARVRIVRQPANAGVAEARNAGVRNATGSHISFLDSDDWWHPRKLELQLQQMTAAGALVSYAAYQRVAEDGRALSMVRPPAAVGYADMLKSNHIGNLTGLYDRRLGDAAFQRIGHEDYVFWLQRVRSAGRALCVQHHEPLAFYLVRSGSVSANKLRAARWQWRIYRDVERLPLAKALWYLSHYIANAVAKRSRRE